MRMEQAFHREVAHLLRPRFSEREAAALTRILLEEVGGLTRNDILLREADNALPEETRRRIARMALRIANQEPWQYVVGATDFDGLHLHVEPGVLIPRPETEALVRHIAQGWQAEAPSRLLDIGTGSGCIALALKRRRPQAYVEAWDVSAQALGVARGNARTLGLEVSFRQRDILSLPAEEGDCGRAPFDLLVSNPPYVRRCEAADMEAVVLAHEPHEALFVPDHDPLLFCRAIALQGRRLLREGGTVWLEINKDFGAEVCQLLRQEGYGDTALLADDYGHDRYVRAVKGTDAPT